MQRPTGTPQTLFVGQHPSRTASRVIGVAMVLCPVMFLITAATGIEIGETTATEFAAIVEHRTRFTIHTLAYTLAWILLMPVAIGIALLGRGRRGHAVTTTGAALAIVGGAALACVMYGYLAIGRLLTSGDVDRKEAITVLVLGEEDPVVLSFWLLGALALLGLLLMGVGLALGHVVPLWHSALLMAGPLLFFAPPNPPVVVLLWLPWTTGVVLLAPRLLRAPADEEVNSSSSDDPGRPSSPTAGSDNVNTPLT